MRTKSETGFIHSAVQTSGRTNQLFRHIAISMVFLAALGIGLATVPSAGATGYAPKLLYSFSNSGGDGANPAGGALISDANGNLYGTTRGGGASGSGTVFELVNSSGTYSEKVLYSFTGGSDGGLLAGECSSTRRGTFTVRLGLAELAA